MMLYYFSRNSGRRIVHTAECSYIKNVDVEYIGAFETLDEAYKSRYRLCCCCNSLRKQYKRELASLIDFGRGNAIRFRIDDQCVWIYTPYSKWRIVSVENTGKFILYHKNTYETPRDMDSLIPGYHIQKTKKSNILGYFKYIVEHEYYRMTHPVCPPQRAKKRQPPRKGTKRYKNQKRREARYERKRAIKNVLNMIDYLSAHETQGCTSRV